MVSANILSGPFFEIFAEASFVSIKDLVDEIIVVDSSPGTNPNAEINHKYATTILDFPGGGTKDFSFSAARELARVNSSYDWVLKWDQDEILQEKYIDILKDLATREFSAIAMRFWHHYYRPEFIKDIGGGYKKFLFKKNCLSWENSVHEQPVVTGDIWEEENVMVNHYGYCRGARRILEGWKLYLAIEGKTLDIEKINMEHLFDADIPTLIRYEEEHPKAVLETLQRMFPW